MASGGYVTLRDAERFKDKFEVRLDNRQIFFLFFGGAVLASLVFVLGVMVGKRLEARDQVAARAATSAALDPLAALDELAQDEEGSTLEFAATLAGDKTAALPTGAVENAPSVAPPEPPPLAKGSFDRAKGAPAHGPALPGRDASVKDGATPRFTLQLSSFQARPEAEAFAAGLVAGGYRPYIVRSELPDKGVFYRVRVGRYPTWDEAVRAKVEFETAQRTIAYVTRLGERDGEAAAGP